MNKKQMRALALEARDGLTKRQRADFSGVITEKLMKLPCYQNAKALLTYVSFRSEVDTGGKGCICTKSSGTGYGLFQDFFFGRSVARIPGHMGAGGKDVLQ